MHQLVEVGLRDCRLGLNRFANRTSVSYDQLHFFVYFWIRLVTLLEASVLLLELSATAIEHSETIGLLFIIKNGSELLLDWVDSLPIANRVCQAILDGMAREVEKDKGVLSTFVTFSQLHFDFTEQFFEIIVIGIADVNDVVNFGTECLDSLSEI